MTTLTEKGHAGGFVISEANGHLSRDAKILISGQNLVAGTVCGLLSIGTASAAAKSGGNTGNGVFTIDATNPVRPGAKVGVYTARCITAAANGGTFRVEDPDGNVLGDVAVGATFDDDIKFVIADGAADFIVGDGFDITVVAGSGKATQFSLTANVATGAQIASCVLFDSVDASGGDKPCVVMSRSCEVNGNELIWPAGITDPQKLAAIAQLAAVGIIVR